MNRCIAVLQTAPLPLGYCAISPGAVDEARTRDLNLGKVALYQLSYYRANGAEGRNRTADTGIFSPLLYRLSYLGNLAEPTGLEPAISGLTGRRVNQLHHGSRWWAKQGSNL